MSLTAFVPSAFYEVREAYHNLFVEGIPHPDRVMEEHDLIYLMDGEWEVFEEGTPYLLRAGDVLILTAGRHHYGERPCRDRTRTIYIHARGPARSCTDAEEPGPASLPLSARIPCAHSPEVPRLFEEIAQQFSAPSPVREGRLSALFQLLLAALWEAQHTPAPSPDEAFAQEVARFIKENPDRFFTQQELAARFYVCARTLSKRFSAVMGVTPSQYQRTYRIEAARAFLASHPGSSLRQAAENFGFCDEFHLSRALRSRTEPPSRG